MADSAGNSSPLGPQSAPRGFFQRRLVQPVLDLLRQGITAEKVALSLAFGLGVGIFPVLGVSTVLCTVIAIVLRLNLPAIQLVNYLASPLQLALIIPFVRVGEYLAGSPPQPLSISEGFRILAVGALHAINVLWEAIVHAAIGWIAIGPVLIFALYRLLRPVLARTARLIRPATASAAPADCPSGAPVSVTHERSAS